MNLTHARLLASVGLAALVSLAYAAPARAQALAPDLGTAGSYTVLGTSDPGVPGTVSCTDSGAPPDFINGDVGSTGGFTNVPPCTINGDIDTNLGVAGTVVTDFDAAYDAVPILNPVCDGVIPIVTTTLPPGVYCSAAGTTFVGAVTITLDGVGDPNAVWVFRIGTGGLGALTGGAGFEVVMANEGDACNVYWWTAEGATMTDAVFAGNVLSGAAATMTDTSWEGRALATEAVTLTNSTITGCAAAPLVISEIPTLGPAAMAGLVALLAGLGLLVLRRLSG